MSTDHFRGRSAIVTGAASGIGREIARQLVDRGARVLATDLPGEALDALGAELASRGAGRARPVDVTDRDQLTGAIDEVVAEHGRLDLMFNNAGVAIFGEFDLVSLDEWDTIIDVNLRGVAHGSTLAYRQMVAQGGGGHIVNTASSAALVPVALQAHYCATKQGVFGLTRTLALEAADHDVQVSVFCPAWVESGMFDNNTMHGTMDGVDARALVPVRPLATDVAVARLLRGVERRREVIITPFYGRLGWWLERLSPAASHRLHRATLAQLRARAGRGASSRA